MEICFILVLNQLTAISLSFVILLFILCFLCCFPLEAKFSCGFCSFTVVTETSVKQECIPVKCVPSAAVAVSAPGGGYLVLGMYLPRGCTWSRGVYLPGGYLSGGVPGPGGVPAWGSGGYLPRYSPLPPVNRMTDRCKNITFATLLQMVIRTNRNAFQLDPYRPLMTIQGVSVWGISLTETLSTEIPPGQGPPDRHPPGQRPPVDRDPLSCGLWCMLGQRPPTLWTEWHTGVKTLPCPKLRLRAVKTPSRVYSKR